MSSDHLPSDKASDLIRAMRAMNDNGLNTGAAGNASCRGDAAHFLITPTGIPALALEPRAIVTLSYDGAPSSEGFAPSSEWRMHADIYLARPEVGAIAHTHSACATALACCHESIPAFHYMVAVAGGDNIRCAPYALFGSQALSHAAVRALDERRACLLANHGVLALGATPAQAVALALEVEHLAQQYLLARQSGQPKLLNAQQMRDVLEKFKNYGQQP